jgi:predicted small metal-binding protein
MAWSTLFTEILKDNTIEWANTKGKAEERANLVKRVAEEVREKHQEDHIEDPIPADLQKVCKLMNLSRRTY